MKNLSKVKQSLFEQYEYKLNMIKLMLFSKQTHDELKLQNIRSLFSKKERIEVEYKETKLQLDYLKNCLDALTRESEC